MTVIPLAALQATASVGEWAYWMFTLSAKQLTLRRNSVDYLDRSVCWSIEKLKQRLG
jgi:sterol-4alpha-carboxylate 3-dehydrogenase (decarboxylating)